MSKEIKSEKEMVIDGKMEKTFVVIRGQMPNGTDIQLENWHDTYDFMNENATLGTYPVSKADVPSIWAGSYPKRGESFRCGFDFENEIEARDAYMNLLIGNTQLIDYIDKYKGTISKADIIECLIGKREE